MHQMPRARGLARWGAVLLAGLLGCSSAPPAGGGAPGIPTPRADDLLIVDCLLPGEIRKLGRKVVFATPRRPTKTTAVDCEIRGGEYAAYDRASYATALQVWLPAAQQGDAKAQTYVGEIYEKGLGTRPDHAAAGVWYRRAAEQGEARAQINLGQLYELGLGVARDPAEALRWYRRASGLAEADVAYLPAAPPALPPEPEPAPAGSERHAALEAEVEHLQAELATLRDERRRRNETAAAERDALEATRRELGASRQELEARAERLRLERENAERRAAAAGTTRSTLEQRLAELRGQEDELLQRRQEVSEREAAIAARERAFAGRNQELARLDAEIERLRREAAQWEGASAERQAAPDVPPPQAPDPPPVDLPGPTIHLIEPPIPATRGLQIVASVGPAAERLVVGRVEAPAGLVALTLNGAESAVDARGIFQAHVPMGTRVAVVAIDRQGKRAAREFRLVPPDAAPEPDRGRARAEAPALDFGRYLALVIGNDAYQDLPRLATAGNDAEAVAQVLQRKYGFQMRLLRDATRYQILSALNELRATLTERDNLLIYYAGHGELDQANMRGHWLPVDAERDSTANWISNVAVTDILNAMSARRVLVVADSCYSGALTRSTLARLEAGMTPAAREAWMRAMLQKRARLALTSGGLQPVLDQGGGRHSIFARVFLEVLQANQEVLEGARLFGELAARVTWAAEGVRFEQTPQYAPIQFAGHESGEFFFVPGS